MTPRLQVDSAKFAALYQDQFPKPVQTPSLITGCGKLVAALARDSDVTDVRWAAYMLATVKHECANRWQPIEELGKLCHEFDTLHSLAGRGGAINPRRAGARRRARRVRIRRRGALPQRSRRRRRGRSPPGRGWRATS